METPTNALPDDGSLAGVPQDDGAPGRKSWSVGTLTYTSGGLVVLFCWLLWGDFAWSLKERSVVAVVQVLLKDFGASDMIAGLLIGSLPHAISMMLGPVISYQSDRHRGRWGRRIPFLLIPTPIAALSMVALAFSPAIGRSLDIALGRHSPGLNGSILIVLGSLWGLFEFATITANAVFGGLINDVVPRAVMGRFYGFFRAFSLIAGMIFNFWMLGKAESHFFWIFVGLGSIYGGGFTAMCMNVREGSYPPPPERAGGLVPAAKAYVTGCFGHTYYLYVFAIQTLTTMAFLCINLFSIFFAKGIGMSLDTYGKYVALTYLISLCFSYPLGSLADRFHPLRVGLVSLALYAVVTLWGGLFATSATIFAIALVAHGVLSGTWMTSAAALGQMLFPRESFAKLASATSLFVSMGSMIVGPILGKFLDYTHHVYRYTYLAGFWLTVLALISGVILHAKFMALGGPRNYVAPE